jgi:hypothetical protein
MKIKLKDVIKNVPNRPENYLETVISKGIVNDGYIEIPNRDYRLLMLKYNRNPNGYVYDIVAP